MDGNGGIWVVAVGHHFGKQRGDYVGYYGHKRIKVGEKFKIKSENEFSKKWMERLTDRESDLGEEERRDTQSDQQRASSNRPKSKSKPKAASASKDAPRASDQANI